MRLFGLPVPFTGESSAQKSAVGFNSVPESRGGWFRVLEAFTGAFQRNIEVNADTVLSFHAVYACVTLICGDIAKLRVKLVKQSETGVWSEFKNPAYSPVLRKPNLYQNRIQFWENWIISKLLRGNVYALKVRDSRGVVIRLLILHPDRCHPLVAEDGSVFYQVDTDNLSAIKDSVVVPAREIIHDRWNCLFHPLVGTSPLFANGLAATQGLKIQNHSALFFANGATPSGILTAPATISNVTAERLKTQWQENYGGKNAGKIAVLGDGLKFEQMVMTAVDAQLIEQLKWSSEVVCSTFHVPPYKVGLGPMPTFNNIQSLNVEYYSQCLQILIEAAELCLDEGLEMKEGVGTEFDLDGLLRMDSVTQMNVLKEGVAASVLAPNEARKKIDCEPVEGGDSPMIQQQNYSLAALAKRDARPDPFATTTTAPPGPTSAEQAASAAAKAEAVVAADAAKKMLEQKVIEAEKAYARAAEAEALAKVANDNAEAAKALLTIHKGLG